MNRVVPDEEHVLGHSERDAQHVLDEEEDEGGDGHVPSDDEEGADDLDPDLAAVPRDGAAGVGEAKRGGAVDLAQESALATVHGQLRSRDRWLSADWLCGSALTVAKMPVKKPPTKPATRCLWKTPSVSSTYLNSQSLFLTAG
jgi:hypothetical protein